jgi:hypothetical protein
MAFSSRLLAGSTENLVEPQHRETIGRSSPLGAIVHETGEPLFRLILNAYWGPLEFELPPADYGCENPWRLATRHR